MNNRQELEKEIIADIGDFIDYHTDALEDVLAFKGNQNKIIANIKLAEAAYLYNAARSYYIDAELYKVAELDNISKEHNKMVNMQTAAMWLNNFVDILLQAEWFWNEIYRTVTKLDLTNDNFERILRQCTVNNVKNNQPNIYIKFLLGSNELSDLRQKIVNTIKHRGAIYSKEIEDSFIGSYSLEFRDENGVTFLDNSVFETKLYSYETLKSIVNKNLKFFKQIFEYYVHSHEDNFPSYYK